MLFPGIIASDFDLDDSFGRFFSYYLPTKTRAKCLPSLPKYSSSDVKSLPTLSNSFIFNFVMYLFQRAHKWTNNWGTTRIDGNLRDRCNFYSVIQDEGTSREWDEGGNGDMASSRSRNQSRCRRANMPRYEFYLFFSDILFKFIDPELWETIRFFCPIRTLDRIKNVGSKPLLVDPSDECPSRCHTLMSNALE